jgi:hypothetical protein
MTNASTDGSPPEPAQSNVTFRRKSPGSTLQSALPTVDTAGTVLAEHAKRRSRRVAHRLVNGTLRRPQRA